MVIQLVVLCVFVLLGVAFFSLFERKLMGLVQMRKGPNKVGLMGTPQPFADAIKLVLKMEVPPMSSSKSMYWLSPFLFFFLSMMSWVLYSSEWVMVNLPKGIFFLLVMYSLSVYGIILSGWFSNSKYATLGSARALAQSISYEIGLTTTVVFLSIIFSSSSLEYFLDLQDDLILAISLFFIFIMYFVSMVSELNRAPFDLAEGESELVSGYSVEYGGLSYTMIFLGENLSILWACFVLGVFFWKEMTPLLIILFVWIRATVPRIRYDKMMNVFWVSILPMIMVIYISLFSLL